jgi:DNA-binding GntR family transcriptional regulator
MAVGGDDVDVLDRFTELDQLFHQCIFDATCNPYLSVTLGSIRRMQIEVITLINREVGSLVVAAEHHLEIAKAIVDGDADAAAEAMDRHIVYTATRVAESLALPLGRTAKKGGTDGQTTERHWS